ncbi:MAG: carboxypeptidase regulatory-like domain-containing protein, partial [Elusimicrobiota bacterium]
GDGYLYAVGRSSGTGSDKDLLIVKISSSGAAVTTPAVTTPATTYYYIKGYVKDSGGTGISGVTVNCTGTSPYTTTSNGYYEFLNLTASGNYTITPSKTDYVFSPTDKSYTTLSANQSDQNFTGRKPLLSASVSSLDFGEVVIGNSKSLTFTITDSTSTGLLSGTISDDVNWITTDVTTFTGNSTVVTVTVNTTGLSKSQYSGTITLTSNGGNTSITVSVSATCVLTKPNPYNPRAGKVTFFGSGVVPNDTKIRIYTVSGDLVKTVNTTTTDSQGQPVLEWDGKNEDGDMVVSGVYIYVSESPKEKAHGKFTVIKK